MRNDTPTQARLKELVTHDPLTGVFTRLISTSSRARAGAVAGYLDRSHGYVSFYVDGVEHYAHRLAWLYVTGHWPKTGEIDHRDCVRSHNSFANLRHCTKKNNTRNAKKSRANSSGFKGVSWHKQARKWAAQICADGKHYNLGLFNDAGLAHDAYVEAADRLHGEFANHGD